MNTVHDENCVLILEDLVFDKISFTRKDFRSDREPEFSFEISAGKKNNEDIYKVTIIMSVKKEKEYDIEISLSGFFSINTEALDENVDKAELISKNTVAILMPYMRSELSLLTAQPGVECIVMPPINVDAMMEHAKRN
ncbi:MAG: protein-export chaperone SecB [Eubacterium sp.]|nr:protein-export chaperone SecB [Eubacterium sp.]MCM1213918.1 protein-export chaperone SecB [Lachnospiraceae bacterium]MCM1304087.1 protein-export chaperone SecB [Butyrivibrio sp.]MCM1343599.1 protein-export chaperone SecB [Muribaculaceae bacterium]MCM1411232.1 protein-export chaperone SecB [Lachnospiraceae bacterium]